MKIDKVSLRHVHPPVEIDLRQLKSCGVENAIDLTREKSSNENARVQQAQSSVGPVEDAGDDLVGDPNFGQDEMQGPVTRKNFDDHHLGERSSRNISQDE